ncbi:MAG: sodium:proton antiporter [Myxococcales bacterium]|nr:sodium:proton antiporter [Myxococcales bacterium]
MSGSDPQTKRRSLVNLMQEFSLPLLAGVVVSLILANMDSHLYHTLVHYKPLGDVALFGHPLTLHFLINDVFMVLFFGIAAKEITESVLPGGPLNPIRKAVNPLMGTIGGVVGPALCFLVLSYTVYSGTGQADTVANGWGIPTATDIALAWLVARLVFGATHPAVNFLLLLAVADDALGLGIIAIFYPDPAHPVHPEWLGLVAVAMGLAFAMRRMGVRSWVPYVVFAGALSWVGLLMASLHPALTLVPIVPFMPGPNHDLGLYTEHEDEEQHGHSPLEEFEHQLKLPVDFGLFFFAFANAGVAFGSINAVTWIVLASLIVGKTIGITAFSTFAERLGFPLPEGMSTRHLVVAGLVAGLGLTVALFVSGEAYSDAGPFQGPAKMGAVLSAGVAFFALAFGRLFRVDKLAPPRDEALEGPGLHTPLHDVAAAISSTVIPARPVSSTVIKARSGER